MNRSTKQLLLLAASFLTLSINAATSNNNKCRDNCDITSHTYFSVRPQFQVGSPEFVSLTRSLNKKERTKWGGHFQATVFGGQSTSKSSLGTFFAPFGSNSFTVDGTIEEGSCNISPQHFNIFGVRFSDHIAGQILGDETNLVNPFRSAVTLNPRQSVIGLGLSWHQGFKFCDNHFWFNISGPVLHVENTMGLSECIERTNVHTVDSEPNTNLADPKKTMSEAFSQAGWCFGKIDCGKRDETELAFLQLRVGHVMVENENCSLETFFGITIPTGNAPKANYVFEPLAGNGDHFGLLWGGSAFKKLKEWKQCDMHLNLACDVTMQYLFKKTQKRSFDLLYRPWSRYIELYATKALATQANTLIEADDNELKSIFLASPGINVLTQDVKVKPGFNFSSNMALIFETPAPHNGFNIEIGYNFYAREAECLNLDKNCSLEAAIKDHVGMGATNPIRNMTSDELNNEASFLNLQARLDDPDALDLFDNRKLTLNDFDLKSAAHPCVLSHTIYGAFNYSFRDWCWPMMVGIGGSYEFSGQNNAALERWLLWGKLGVSF